MSWLCRLFGHRFEIASTEPDLSHTWEDPVFNLRGENTGLKMESCRWTRNLHCQRCQTTKQTTATSAL